MSEKAKKNIKLALMHIGGIGAVVGILTVLCIFDIPFCPINFIFKIGCPFCGMTRAHLSALRLDFASAFSYHPLFPLGIPFIWLLCHDFFFEGSKKLKIIYRILELTILAALIITYIIRVSLYGFAFC